jgi:hypothetical protein
VLEALLLLLLAAPAAAFEERPELRPFARIAIPAAREASALLKSPKYPGVYWTLNDSRNGTALFAFTRDGRPAVPPGEEGKAYYGVRVEGAENRDWEALAADGKGNLYIADIGNNANKRRDLAVYVVPEPDPYAVAVSSPARKILFSYPDQDAFPPRLRNFDAEALFWHAGSLYLLTKHRADTSTKLYRFRALDASPQKLEYLGTFDARAMVTDAAIAPDGKKLAVLTYDGLWLLELPAKGRRLLSGKKSRFAFGAGQCEGVAFDGPDLLLVGNEAGDLFEVSLSSFSAR